MDSPILKPIIALLKSRKFMTAVLMILTSVIIARVPELAVMREEITVVIITAGLAVIGGTAWEDSAAAGRSEAANPRTTEQLTQEAIQEALRVLFQQGGEFKAEQKVTVENTDSTAVG